MNESSKQNQVPDAPFGKQFAETWTLLQRYLSDLDTKELSQLSNASLEETLALLKRQPALGHSGALNRAQDMNPEQLAVAILQERLSALDAPDSDEPKGTWGARFLSSWRRGGGPISSFTYAQIQKLKHGDQAQVTKAILAKAGGSYQTRQALKSSTPEEAARILLLQYRMGQLMVAAILL